MVNTARLLDLLTYAVPLLYLAALVPYGVSFLSESGWAQRLARPLLIVAVALDAVFLTAFVAFYQHLPLVTVPQVLGGVGFAMALTYLWIEARTGNIHTGPFVVSLILACKMACALQPRFAHHVPELLRDVMFSLHVSAAVLGYSAFALAAAYALAYLLLYNAMRGKRFGLVFNRLPSLVELDRMNFCAAVVGFVFLSVALLLGFVWIRRAFATLHLDAKIVVAVLTWGFYGLTIWGRRFRAWRGPRLAWSSLFGFVTLLLSMSVVNFHFSKFHMFT